MTEREAFEAELSKLPASMQRTVRDSMSRGESLSFHFWQAACAWQRDQILAMLPGGYSVDPQWLADEIRAQGEQR